MASRKTKRQSNRPRLIEYAAYRFMGQDPIIGEALAKIADIIDQVHDRGGAHRSTTRSWERKRNRAARTDTLNASLRTAGYRLAIVKNNT